MRIGGFWVKVLVLGAILSGGVFQGCAGDLAPSNELLSEGRTSDFPVEDLRPADLPTQPEGALESPPSQPPEPAPSSTEERALEGTEPPQEEPQGTEPPADGEQTDLDEAEPSGLCPDFAAFGDMADCCEGTGSCVPMEALPEGLQSQVSPCDDGSACVPKSIITSIEEEAGFWPRECESIGGAEGVCLSTCIPKVGQFASLLPLDVCGAGERCAPCIDPLTGVDSGACGDGLQCLPPGEEESLVEPIEGDDAHDQGEQEQASAFSCDNPPSEPVVDPDAFEECGVEAHCVPDALVEPHLQEKLASCEGGFCVPDPMIASAGFFVPQTCTSINGMEGRCMSTVLPDVGALADSLPVDVCESHERCSPCCDPFTGLTSEVCDQGCDLGPAEECSGESEYVSCCGGEGHCIGPELIPDGLESSLAKCKGEAKGTLCVPDAMQDPDYAGTPCQGDSLILGSYHGVCLPQCLKIFLEISFDKSPCGPGHMCVPCDDPITGGTTDAPGCQP